MEVLVASLLLAVLLLGVLELFSLSLLTDAGSATRTDLTYRCQQVVESLRHVGFLRHGGTLGGAPPSSATGIPDVPLPGLKYGLPYRSTDAGWDYWGPAGAGVMDEPDGGPFRVFYRYVDAGAFWTVTVTARATAPASSDSAPPGTGPFFKSVEYVAKLRKP